MPDASEIRDLCNRIGINVEEFNDEQLQAKYDELLKRVGEVGVVLRANVKAFAENVNAAVAEIAPTLRAIQGNQERWR